MSWRVIHNIWPGDNSGGGVLQKVHMDQALSQQGTQILNFHFFYKKKVSQLEISEES